MSDAPLPRRGELMWSRGPRLLDRLTFVVMCLALAVELGTVVAASFGVFIGVSRDGDPLGGYVAVAFAAAGLVIGRRYPWGGIVLIGAAPIASVALGWDPTATWSVCCFAAFWFTLRGAPGLPVALVLGGANLVAVGWWSGSIRPSQAAIPSLAAFIAVLLATAGSSVRGHQQYWFSLEQRTQEAIASRQVAVERSIAEERLRIARDLHDSVGHQVAVVSMHLGAAEVHLPRGADQSRADLHAARAAVQEVLRETQQILKVLRVDTGGASGPTPGYEQIEPLVAGLLGAGFVVRLSMPSTVPDLRPNVGTAAFRIVQEALTNSQRYGTGSASMTIRDTDDVLTIDIANARREGVGVGPGGGGHGLIGMRERAESVGGSFETGTQDKMFWVRAQLPHEVEGRDSA